MWLSRLLCSLWASPRSNMILLFYELPWGDNFCNDFEIWNAYPIAVCQSTLESHISPRGLLKLSKRMCLIRLEGMKAPTTGLRWSSESFLYFEFKSWYIFKAFMACSAHTVFLQCIWCFIIIAWYCHYRENHSYLSYHKYFSTVQPQVWSVFLWRPSYPEAIDVNCWPMVYQKRRHILILCAVSTNDGSAWRT